MRIIFLGAPGSGKGTQALRLKQALALIHVSTGDLLRAQVAAGTALGLQAKAVMESGNLVSDDIVLGMLEQRLMQADAQSGFILDGYPRNLTQAAALEKLLVKLKQPLNIAILLDVSNALLVERLAGRAKAEGRKDDKPETVRERLRIYDEQTAPLIQYYKDQGLLKSVDGVGGMDDVFSRILAAVRAST
jgi:adenylate kinase